MNLPNYAHRTFVSGNTASDEFGTTDLADSVGLMVEQTEAVILQMQNQYADEGCNRNTAATNFSTLECIRKELLDIDVLINWFHDKETKASAKGGRK